MDNQGFRVLIASETPELREALLDAIRSLNCSVESVLPTELLEMDFSGFVLILLETGDDVERLVTTVRRLWDTWGETGKADLQFLCYPPAEHTTDKIVFQLWGIGPEMTAIVPTWTPERLPEVKMEAMSWTKRIVNALQKCDVTEECKSPFPVRAADEVGKGAISNIGRG